MRSLALACVLLRVTPPSPNGPIGDMASAPGGLRTPLGHLPAPDALAFRLDEFQFPWSARPPRGEILISPNRSTIVGITATDASHEFERSPARKLAEITAAIRQLLSESAQFDQLGGRLLPMADNNFTNFSSPLQWAPFPLPFAPYFNNGIRPPSIFSDGAKLASNDCTYKWHPALRFIH